MRYFKVLGLALLAVFALGAFAAVSTSAQGLPSILPETAEKTADAVSAATTFKTLSGKVVKCTAASGEATEMIAGKPLGPMHITFTGCTSTEGGVTVKCTGLGDAAPGEILVLGEWHLVYDTGGAELGVAILFLVNATHFACGGVFLIKVNGEVVCLILEPYVLKELHEFHCKGSGGGEQTETYLNDEGATQMPLLDSSTNEAMPEPSEEVALSLILWLEKGKTKDVLIMMT